MNSIDELEKAEQAMCDELERTETDESLPMHQIQKAMAEKDFAKVALFFLEKSQEEYLPVLQKEPEITAFLARAFKEAEKKSKKIIKSIDGKIHIARECLYNLEPIDGLTLLFILRDIDDRAKEKISKLLEQEKSNTARIAARARLANDPKQKHKQEVYNLYVEWQKDPEKYKGPTEFARDMIGKFGKWNNEGCIEDGSLESEAVIVGWCREWKKELEKSSQRAD